MLTRIKMKFMASLRLIIGYKQVYSTKDSGARIAAAESINNKAPKEYILSGLSVPLKSRIS